MDDPLPCIKCKSIATDWDCIHGCDLCHELICYKCRDSRHSVRAVRDLDDLGTMMKVTGKFCDNCIEKVKRAGGWASCSSCGVECYKNKRCIRPIFYFKIL